jgi:histidinol phosphatase-like enzyme
MKPAVFFDRDGVLIEERNYLHRVEDVVLLTGVAAALSVSKMPDSNCSSFPTSPVSGAVTSRLRTWSA